MTLKSSDVIFDAPFLNVRVVYILLKNRVNYEIKRLFAKDRFIFETSHHHSIQKLIIPKSPTSDIEPFS
jgi:hypothetical protein